MEWNENIWTYYGMKRTSESDDQVDRDFNVGG